MSRPFEDLSGTRFGRLFVLAFDHFDRWGGAYFLVQCDCGTEKSVLRRQLISKDTVSCGCYHSEVMRERRGEKSATYKHGHATLQTLDTYDAWRWQQTLQRRRKKAA